MLSPNTMESQNSDTFSPITAEYLTECITYLESLASEFCNGNIPLAGHPRMTELIKYDPLHQAVKGRDILIAYNAKLWKKMKTLKRKNDIDTWPIQICAMRIAYCTELIRLP